MIVNRSVFYIIIVYSTLYIVPYMSHFVHYSFYIVHVHGILHVRYCMLFVVFLMIYFGYYVLNMVYFAWYSV